MKQLRFKYLLVFAVLLLFKQAGAQSFSVPQQKTSPQADADWKTSPVPNGFKKLLDVEPGAPNSASVRQQNEELIRYNAKLDETWRLDYRQWGIDFWNKYPTDLRRFKWLKNTITDFVPGNFANMDQEPAGKSDLPVFPKDVQKEKKWEKEYAWMRAELLASPQLSPVMKLHFKKDEITNRRGLLRQRIFSPGKGFQRFNLEKWTRQAFELAKEYYKVYTPFIEKEYASIQQVAGPDWNSLQSNEITDPFPDAAEVFFLNSTSFGLNMDDLESMVKTFAAAPYINFRVWARMKKNIMDLRKTPLEFSFTALDGRHIDLAAMKGKLVLLDFWSTSCGSCISMMPHLRTMYEKYQAKGFEVISVCVNPETAKKEVEAIYNRIGANWPLLLIGGQGDSPYKMASNSLAKKLWNTYGFSYVPQLFLIGKDGKLISYQGEMLDHAMMENFIARHLD